MGYGQILILDCLHVEFRKYLIATRFGQLILAMLVAVFGFILFMQWQGNAPVSAILMPGIIILFVAALIATLHVRVYVTDQLIVRFFPFPARVLSFSEIVSARVVQYKPITDYGGWGIKWGKSGTAYTISGNMGVKVELENGKHVMIDSKTPAALANAIEVARG